MRLPAWRYVFESRLVSRIASIIVLAAASFALFGWLTNNAAIKSIFSGLSPLSAVTFLLVSSAVLLMISGKEPLARRVLAVVTVLVSVLTLIEVIFGVNTGLDHLFVITRFGDQPIPIAPNSAVVFILIAAALLPNEKTSRRRVIVGQTCALIAALIASLALAGHIYNLNSLYTFRVLTPMALVTSCLFLLTCLGILTAKPNRGLTSVLVSPTIGGALARRLLPVAILVPMILSGLQVLVARLGVFADESDVIVFATLTSVVMACIFWWNAQMIDQADRARKQAEEALRASEVRYRALYENSSDAILIFNDQGQYLDANPQAERLTGYSRDEILHLKVGDMTPRRQADAAPQRLEAARKQGAWSGEGILVRKDGSELTVELAAVPIAPGFHQSVFRDISERKQAEEALRISEARYRGLFEYASDAIMVFDEQGHYLDANAQTERLTGYSHDELLHMSVGDMVAPPQADVAQKRLDAAKHQGAWSGEAVLVCKDGSERVVDLSSVVVAPGLHQSVFRDISERKQIENNLRASLEQEHELNELKSRFVSMVSHDFRNPLAVIRSSTDLLLNYGDRMDAAKRRERLEKIQQQIERMVQMLEDILLIGKAETVGLEFNPEMLNLGEFCTDLIAEVQPAAPDHHIEFTAQGDWHQVTCDPKLLRQAITNLLTNAVKYSPGRDRVRFDLNCSAEEILLRVQDEGIGIPEKDQAHLFETFHRAGNVGSISGTGLGLPIVKQAVEAHGGTIRLESQAGVGTTFTICLPRAQNDIISAPGLPARSALP